MSTVDDDYQWLESARFSIRSPKARAAKCVQQELDRASERRRRPRKDCYLHAVKHGKGSKARRSLDPQRNGVMLKEAHKYLPQCDELLQNAVDLYIASQLQNQNSSVNQLKIQHFDKIMQDTVRKFLQENSSIQAHYFRAAVLSQFKEITTCSDPFQILLALHWEQSTAGLGQRRGHPKLETNIDIGPFAHNLERAEAGEECDATRLRLISWKNCVAEARNLWKLMSPDQKLPFFMQAYMASHFPASMDQAL